MLEREREKKKKKKKDEIRSIQNDGGPVCEGYEEIARMIRHPILYLLISRILDPNYDTTSAYQSDFEK
jgi:hypothetical protein